MGPEAKCESADSSSFGWYAPGWIGALWFGANLTGIPEKSRLRRRRFRAAHRRENCGVACALAVVATSRLDGQNQRMEIRKLI